MRIIDRHTTTTTDGHQMAAPARRVRANVRARRRRAEFERALRQAPPTVRAEMEAAAADSQRYAGVGGRR